MVTRAVHRFTHRAPYRACLVLTLGLLYGGAAPEVSAATRAMCQGGQWEVKASRRGDNWWRCCTTVPQGILRKKSRQLCFHCSGEFDKVNCDQLPQVGADAEPEEARPAPAVQSDTSP